MSYDPKKLDALADALKERGFVIHTTETPPEIPPPPPVEDAPTKQPEAPTDQPVETMDRDTWVGFVAKHLNDCPECYGDLYKQVYKGDHVCEDCGLPLGSHEHAKALEECPDCGAKGASKRW